MKDRTQIRTDSRGFSDNRLLLVLVAAITLNIRVIRANPYPLMKCLNQIIGKPIHTDQE
jgi:hypothetical protein